MKAFVKIILLFLCSILSLAVNGQKILLDKPVKAGELTLFPEVRNKDVYYYLSDKPRLAVDEVGRPKFSFLRYVQNKATDGANSINEGEGGGIVHAVVELGVTEEQLNEAKRELRRINSSGSIKGPIIYRGGTIALISSFAETDGEFIRKVIGLGKAPVIDGQKAAVSVLLTKQGAKILWESFKTPTPDMSISFEMELEGYQSPKRAIIEADFEQIYEHKNFEAAIAAPILAADIKATFDDLVKKGDIKVTQIGEDANLEKIMETAYNKILSMMFDPAGGTGTPSLGSLTSLTDNKPSLLDRATSMLGTARSDARSENERIRRANQEERNRVAAINESNAQAAEADGATQENEADTTNVRPDTRRSSPTNQPPVSGPVAREASPDDEPGEVTPELQSEVTEPSFAIAASFQFKKIRQKGTFRIDLNKYTTDNLVVRFDENFGSIDCNDCFHQVNLDDELYKQREITAFVDGANATDFGNFINFATVLVQKKHHNGELTQEEVRIDRNNFNQEGNNFKLIYGWKNDTDRSEWLEYEYKTTWSFFGGAMVENPWEKTEVGAIALAPPFLPRDISIEADPTRISEQNIRAINLKLFYNVGDEEKVATTTLRPSREEFSRQLTLIQPRENIEYDYQVEWIVSGNQTITSPRMTSSSAVLFVDELPENN